jgi:hypothetical protein
LDPPDDPEKAKPSRRRRRLGMVFVCTAFAALLLAAWAAATGRLTIPERFNPWAPLDVMASPDWLTGFKLSRARSEPAMTLLQRCARP